MGKHAKFPEPLAYYARVYARSYETVKAWVAKGKAAHSLPPLAEPTQFVHWYRQHVRADVPDDLWARCVSADAAPVADDPSADNGQDALPPVSAPAEAARLVDLEQADIELGGILGADIAEYKRMSHSDPRRGMLNRQIQQISIAKCRVATALAAMRREQLDLLPWATYEQGIAAILGRLIEIRKSFAHRILAEIETAWVSERKHRCARVVRLLREPLSTAVEKVCEQDVLLLVSCPELRPVFEQYRQRARELAAAPAGITPIPTKKATQSLKPGRPV